MEPRARIAKLVDFCKELAGDLVLVGSSVGGYVSVASASLLHARGVFLMARRSTWMGCLNCGPASSTAPRPWSTGGETRWCLTSTACDLAQTYHTALHLLESDHRLHNQIRVIQYLFEYFLIALDLPPIAFE